jgi:hypothetical protein
VIATVALSAAAVYLMYVVREPLGDIFLGSPARTRPRL